MTKILVDDQRDLGAFIPSFLCDWGLDPYEFRVYCRIARRAGNGQCWESIDSIATGCKMNRKTVMKAIASLLELKMIVRSRADNQKPSSVDKYTLTHHKYWIEKGCPPEGHGCPPEGHGCPPEGHGCPPEGHGCPPEGHKGNPNKGKPIKSDPNKREEAPALSQNFNPVNLRDSTPEQPSSELLTTLPRKPEALHQADHLSSNPIVPASLNNLENRKSAQVDHYRNLDSQGITLKKPELREWAQIEMSDHVKCYRKSGVILTGGADISNEFAAYVSEQNCKKGQEPTIAHGLNVINKCEADPRSWQKLITWVTEWARSRELGKQVNAAATHNQGIELQRIHEASKRKFEL
jgi:DNA-binding transcriptional MocR family regulator